MKNFIQLKSLLILTIGFIVFTPIGTLSHEFGHIIVAKYFGFETSLHSASMNYFPKGYLEDSDVIALQDIEKEYTDIAYDSLPENIKKQVDEYDTILQKRYWSEKSNSVLLISMGGPLQTTLTGTIGLLILTFRRKLIDNSGLTALDWIAVFLSLFWLREIFNLVVSIGSELISPNGTWFGGDELHISQMLNFWSGSLSVTLGVLGTVICAYVVFRIIPKEIRPTFILSGLIGGISGYVLWLNIIGPIVLP